MRVPLRKFSARFSLPLLCLSLSACTNTKFFANLNKYFTHSSTTVSRAHSSSASQSLTSASQSCPELNDSGHGIALVKDIYAGAKGSDPALMMRFGNYVYFSADDGVHGRELWKSNGTPACTAMVMDINRHRPPSATDADTVLTGNASPSSLTAIGTTLYFAANDGQHGKELWKSDGTAAGTALLKDINVSTAEADAFPAYLTAVDGRLFFTANDGEHGTELWLSDGTSAGTRLVYDIRLGTAGSSPSSLTVSDGTLYFTANDGRHGNELWKSDGTAAGTVMLSDINLQGSSHPSALTSLGKTLFFIADDGVNGRELWRTDGTAAGTRMVTDINTSPAINGGKSIASGLLVVNGRLYFSADDGRNGVELWTSDGTAQGTHMVRDINPTSSNPAELTAVNGMLYFTADDGLHGVELWKSDGTESGTIMVRDINVHPDIKNGNSYPTALTAANERLFFVADSGNGNGEELWVSDGTASGTVMIRDISKDNTINAGGSSPRDLVDIGGTLYFTAYRAEHGRELYRYR